MGMIVKVVSSLEKVFAIAGEVTQLDDNVLTGLRGETVSFQIAYFWEGPRKGHGFCDVTSPLQEAIRIREVGLVPCEYPCHKKRDDGYLVTEPGLYPDLLTEISTFGFPMVAGQWRSLWVDVEIPREQEAGIYPIQIALKEKDAVLGEVSVTVKVIPAALPALPVPRTEWFHCDCLANYYKVDIFSEAHWQLIEEYVKTAVKHKCNMLLTPVFTPPLDTAVGGERPTVQLVEVNVHDGVYTFDFAKFRRWVAMAQRCGMEYFEISHLFSQWGAVAAPKIMATVDGVYQRIFGWETDASGEEYRYFLHCFLTELKREMAELGIGEKTYFHISDEPSMEHLESYRAALNTVSEELKGYNLIEALSSYEFYRQGLVKQPVCGLDHIADFLPEDKRPEKLWGYYCTAQCVKVSNRFIALPGFRTRILGAQMYQYRLDGFLHWGYNFYNSEYSWYPIDPYSCTDSSGAFPSGDPFLVYPGADGKPVGSIRLMLMDEAMSDLSAMYLLESLCGREAVMACIGEGNLDGFDTYPQSTQWLLNVRRKINEKIDAAVK